jgi:sulfonate transport system substrate-binding protein
MVARSGLFSEGRTGKNTFLYQIEILPCLRLTFRISIENARLALLPTTPISAFRRREAETRETSMAATLTRRALGAAIPALLTARAARADAPTEIRVDWATYNPVSLVLRDQHLLEEAFAPQKINIRWVQSAGSNKALEFLNAGSLDFGSTAGAAALIAKANGNPLKSIYTFSHPEWTALVTSKDSPIQTVADLKDKRVAVTRGTDPHIFLVRALASAGLNEKSVKLVLLQHADGRTALERGDVDAWAGLDPMMAEAEAVSHARLFYRKPEANTWGILNVRDEFAKQNPDIVRKVLTAYETARKWSVANTDALLQKMADANKLSLDVNRLQLTRTGLTSGAIGQEQAGTIIEAGKALQAAGVMDSSLDIAAITNGMIDGSFAHDIGA